MIRLLIGLVLLPTAGLTLAAAGRGLGVVAVRSPASLPFLAGCCLTAAAWLLGRFAAQPGSVLAGLETVLRKLYVFGHELTHALAAWAFGGKVLAFHVGESGGHVDLSQTNAFVALAPYCVPLFALAVIAAYRLILWLRPAAGGQSAFLALMGVTLSFHAVKTCEVLWDRRQPDLAAAGGSVFSISWIALANGLVLLALLKALFPREVPIGGELRDVAILTEGFWRWTWGLLRPLASGIVAQLRNL